jgi:hypothetical protein
MVVADWHDRAMSSARRIAATRSSSLRPSTALEWRRAISCDPALRGRVFEHGGMDIHVVADAGQTVLADVKENRNSSLVSYRLRKPERLDIESEALQDRDP